MRVNRVNSFSCAMTNTVGLLGKQDTYADITRYMLIKYLQIPTLRCKPFVDKLLGVVGEAQVELTLKFDTVDLLHRLVDLSNQNPSVSLL